MWCKQFITHIILGAAEGLWRLGLLFYHDTQYSQLGWFTNLLWCDIPLNKASRTGPHHIWRIYTLCSFSGYEKNTGDSAVGWMISLASVCYGDSSRITFFYSKSVAATRISLMASSSSLIFSPGHCNRHLQRSALFALLCMTWHSCNNIIPLRYEHLLQWQQNRCKATIWQQYKIPAIRGCPRRF